MELSFLKDILVPISTIITLLSVAVGSLIAVFAYRLNLRAETRLKESAKAEIDAKLLGLMVNLTQKANGRSGYEVSHDAIKKVLESDQIGKLDWLDQNNIAVINQLLEDLAILTYPVGASEQDFAIRAIGELGFQHPFLRTISLTTLIELKKIDRVKDLCEELTLKLNSK
jgi:hypothetical protein